MTDTLTALVARIHVLVAEAVRCLDDDKLLRVRAKLDAIEGYAIELEAALAAAPVQGWQPALCPLCLGRGYVSAGFYSSEAEHPWASASTTTEPCRMCASRGYLPAPSAGANKEQP